MLTASRVSRLLSSIGAFFSRHPLVLLLSGYSACLAIAIASPEAFIADDSYFYLEIARNISSGEGVTFNGVVPTNGFHPLWQLTLIPVAFLTESHATYLMTALITCGILGSVAIVLLYQSLRVHIKPVLAAVCTLPLAVLITGLGVHASEAYLNALTISALLYILTENYGENESYPYLVGAALGLTMLARLDNVFLGGGVCMLLWLRHDFRTSFKAFLTSTIVVMPYLAWNIGTFGHLQPISSATKSSFPHVGPSLGGLSGIHYLLLAALLVCIPITLLLKDDIKSRRILITFGGSAVAQGLYHSLFQSSAGWYWYSVLPALSVSYTFGLLIEPLLRSEHLGVRPKATNIIGVIALAFYAGGLPGYLVTQKYKSSTWNAELGRHLNDSFNTNYTIVVGDWPGALQFWSNLRIIAIDGLTTNYEFRQKLRKNGVNHLSSLNVDGVLTGPHDKKVTINCSEPQNEKCSKWDLNFDSPRFVGRHIGSISVTPQNLIRTISLKSHADPFRIWNWPKHDDSI